MFEKIRRWIGKLAQRSSTVARALQIPEHERPLGRMFQEAYGTPFEPLRSLAEAREYDNTYVILQGDWGGQIYMTAPISRVRCSERQLAALLKTIDQREWECNKGEGAEIFFERLAPGSGVPGGMGGGAATDDLWLHPSLEEAGLRQEIEQALSGAALNCQGA